MPSERRLFIVGAGGLGREIESMYLSAPKGHHDPFTLYGYLDTYVAATPRPPWPSSLPILGAPETFQFQDGDAAIIAIAGKARRMLFDVLSARVEIISFIAYTAVVSPFATVGKGCLIYLNCGVSTNVTLGDGVILNAGTQIGHDVRIGSFSSLMTHVDIGGDCQIGEDVFMGSHAGVVPRKTVADRVQLSAGCILMRSIKEPGGVYYGNPAVRLT